MNLPARLGKYEVRRQVGRGSSGTVYEAFDPLIGRTVAIKVLSPSWESGTTAAESGSRFRREAQAAGRLGHPNIVAVYEYCDDVAGSAPFIVMEFVEGETLKEAFEKGARFSTARIAHLMSQLLSALSHAHARGVVHRDIKSANVMLIGGGPLKVTDFGVARLDDSDLTLTGTTLGTMAFMAPEQLMGQAVDGRADVFSSGVLLYRFLTGEFPFSGSNTSVMQKLLNQEPLAPSLLNTTLPVEWDAIVRKALAKKPKDRFQDCDAFAEAIRKALSADDDETVVMPAPRPQGRQRKRRVVIGTLASFLGAIAACFAAYWWIARTDVKEADTGRKVDAPVLAAAGGSQPVRSRPDASRMEIDGRAVPVPTAATTATTATVAAPVSGKAPGPAQADPSVRAAPDAADVHAWDETRRANTTSAYQAFLGTYPASRFAGRARGAIESIESKSSTRPSTSVTASVAPDRGQRTTQAPSSDPVRQIAEPTASVAAKTPARAEDAPASPSRSENPKPEFSTAKPAQATPAIVASATPSPEKAGSGTPARGLHDCGSAVDQDVQCQLVMANLYRDGKEVRRDYERAFSLYRKAADRGSAEAQFQLGLLYVRGQGAPTDTSEGLTWVRRAADQGYAAAQNRIGLAYENADIGAKPNLVTAVDWFRKAADQGNAAGLSNLGRMYLYGRGVFKDTDKAQALLLKAAEKGSAYGSYFLGEMYETGNGVSRDPQQAVRWYREAIARRSIAEGAMVEHARAVVAANP